MTATPVVDFLKSLYLAIKEQLDFRAREKPESRFLLSNICYCLLEDPLTAQIYPDIGKDDEDNVREQKWANAKVPNFSEVLFVPGVMLRVYDRWGDRTAIIPVQDGTLLGILRTIHDFFLEVRTKYDQTHGKEFAAECHNCPKEDSEEHGWYRGDQHWLAHLSNYGKDSEWEVELLTIGPFCG